MGFLVIVISSKMFQRYLTTSISGVKGVKVFVIHINTVQIVFFHESSHGISSVYWVGSSTSGSVRRSEEGDNQFNSGLFILGFKRGTLTSWKCRPLFSLRMVCGEPLKTFGHGTVDSYFVPWSLL